MSGHAHYRADTRDARRPWRVLTVRSAACPRARRVHTLAY